MWDCFVGSRLPAPGPQQRRFGTRIELLAQAAAYSDPATPSRTCCPSRKLAAQSMFLKLQSAGPSSTEVTFLPSIRFGRRPQELRRDPPKRVVMILDAPGNQFRV